MGVYVSTVIVDEVAQAEEHQSVSAIVANVRMGYDGRIHVVLVEDKMQLPPVFSSCH